LVALLAAPAVPSAARGDELAEFLACRSLDSDVARLECYDQVATTSSAVTKEAASESCAVMTLSDFRLDYRDLAGRCVELEGELMKAGGMAMLSEGMMDMDPILLEYDHLPRDQREIFVKCQMSCRVVIQGTAQNVMFTDGVRVNRIRSK
jgi:hypothetical protein